MITNLGSNQDAAWIPGGGLYLRPRGGGPALGNVLILEQLLSDPIQKKSIRGVILDLRGISDYSSAYAILQYEQAMEYLTIFSRQSIDWATVKTGAIETSLTISPLEKPWPNIPVVALINAHTPGHLALLLQAMPNITTIGQSSGPAIVPTRPVQLDSGMWAYFPEGALFNSSGHNKSLCRIKPDVKIPQMANWDEAVREAMEVIGIEPDLELDFCPRN